MSGTIGEDKLRLAREITERLFRRALVYASAESLDAVARTIRTTPGFAALLQDRARVQRLHDLVRYQRSELYNAGLISDEEYAELVKDHAAVARLESYDEMRKRIATLTAERESWKATAMTLGHPAKMPCGHSQDYSYTEDGGKNIRCLLCSEEYLRKRVETLKRICDESYQVVGALAYACDALEAAEKALDNLSRAEIVHEDVLPFAIEQVKLRDQVEALKEAGHKGSYQPPPPLNAPKTPSPPPPPCDKKVDGPRSFPILSSRARKSKT